MASSSCHLNFSSGTILRSYQSVGVPQYALLVPNRSTIEVTKPKGGTSSVMPSELEKWTKDNFPDYIPGHSDSHLLTRRLPCFRVPDNDRSTHHYFRLVTRGPSFDDPRISVNGRRIKDIWSRLPSLDSSKRREFIKQMPSGVHDVTYDQRLDAHLFQKGCCSPRKAAFIGLTFIVAVALAIQQKLLNNMTQILTLDEGFSPFSLRG